MQWKWTLALNLDGPGLQHQLDASMAVGLKPKQVGYSLSPELEVSQAPPDSRSSCSLPWPSTGFTCNLLCGILCLCCPRCTQVDSYAYLNHGTIYYAAIFLPDERWAEGTQFNAVFGVPKDVHYCCDPASRWGTMYRLVGTPEAHSSVSTVSPHEARALDPRGPGRAAAAAALG